MPRARRGGRECLLCDCIEGVVSTSWTRLEASLRTSFQLQQFREPIGLKINIDGRSSRTVLHYKMRWHYLAMERYYTVRL